ncbi:MAG: nitrous-oxide reductase [Candidatus Dadabacteria bacterium]
MKLINYGKGFLFLFFLFALTGLFFACKGKKSPAEKVYVPPGKYDSYYAFLSGGHSGQIAVYGLPSGRLIRVIPVFAPDVSTGWGISEESTKMMGGFIWGDAHHPALSETNGDYDGRWLFINDNPNARIARINLKTFRTEEIIQIPNVAGNHASPFLTPNTEYLIGATRFSVPVPNRDVPVESYKENFNGVIAFVSVDKDTGHMQNAFQILMPPFDYDLGDAGKLVSYGWAFFSSYNTEEAYKNLEVEASQKDRDFIAAVNWKAAGEAIKQGKYKEINGVKVIDPREVKGIVYFLPTPKSPHGADVSPDGRYIVGGGKLAAVACVHSFEKMQEAIKKGDFDGDAMGIPILKYESVRVAEVPVGLGPLHTQFDDQGYAYTSLFVDSAIAKWKLGTWEVVDKIPVYYNIGHLAAVHGDTVKPRGKFLLALNKIAKGRYLPVGPSHPESAQLIDISGKKMEMLLDFPTQVEPHYAQIIDASLIKPELVYPLDQNNNPYATKSADKTRVERNGNRVDVYMIAIRSHFTPDIIKVQEGDTVYFHLTNLEQDVDTTHGFGISFSNVNISVDPGETVTVKWVPEKPGIYPFYCTNFCSALHQEMQGYIEVAAKGPLSKN